MTGPGFFAVVAGLQAELPRISASRLSISRPVVKLFPRRLFSNLCFTLNGGRLNPETDSIRQHVFQKYLQKYLQIFHGMLQQIYTILAALCQYSVFPSLGLMRSRRTQECRGRQPFAGARGVLAKTLFLLLRAAAGGDFGERISPIPLSPERSYRTSRGLCYTGEKTTW